ncbi:PcfJ domain-containing protein [Acetanaerobacterium elongatum]|uniref:PcfJ-like protein n=1 Tax=Acetanaerobacterium elongatum TaxID=258515 RepID=A0A1G9YZ79_9FIRM|nr:PcfJ domain-containing protein [Acetanaerobacterium elongatum]SDN14438.1 PcfJ-like protein [Acetanaerobacterium elongatum]
MRWTKKELEQIQIDPFPQKLTGHKQEKLVMAAKPYAYHGEDILIATFYSFKSKAPFCRVFLAKDSDITQLFAVGMILPNQPAFTWSKKGISDIRTPNEDWTTINYRDNTMIADNDTKEAVDCFLPNVKVWNDWPLDKIDRFQNRLRSERSTAIMDKRCKSDSEIMEMVFSKLPPLPEDMEQQILDGPLDYSRYMFYRSGKVRDPLTGLKETRYFGYCPYCKEEYELDWIPTHKEKEYRCPGCSSLVTTYARGISRRRLVDRCNYMVWSISGREVFARMFEVERDYSVEPEKVHTHLEECERFYFTDGTAYKFSRYEYYAMGSRYLTYNWHKQTQVTEDVYDFYIYPHPKDIFIGTCAEHSHLDDYLKLCHKKKRSSKPMQYLGCYVKTPSMEHLLDSGLHTLLFERIGHFGGAYKLIDWKKTRPYDMLGVSRPELEQIIKLQLNGEKIMVYKKLKPSGIALDDHGVDVINFLCNSSNNEKRLKRFEQLGLNKTLRYFDYQQRKNFNKAGYATIWQHLKDYHDMCVKLGYDLANDYYLFPPNLKKAHDAAARIIAKQEELANKEKYKKERAEWEQLYKSLSELSYSDGTLLIRPVRSREELILEGKILQHCVAGYADRVRRGETCIFFIRKNDQPDEPYYTLNITPLPKCEFIQCHGFDNDRHLPGGQRPQLIKDFEKKWFSQVVEPWKKKKAKEQQKMKLLQTNATVQQSELIRAVV